MIRSSVTLDRGATIEIGVDTVDVVVGLVVVGVVVVDVVVDGANVVGANVVGTTPLGAVAGVVDGTVVVTGTVVEEGVVGLGTWRDGVVEAWVPTCRAEGTSAVAPPIPVNVMRETTPATPDNDATVTPQRARPRRPVRGWARVRGTAVSFVDGGRWSMAQFSLILNRRVDSALAVAIMAT